MNQNSIPETTVKIFSLDRATDFVEKEINDYLDYMHDNGIIGQIQFREKYVAVLHPKVGYTQSPPTFKGFLTS